MPAAALPTRIWRMAFSGAGALAEQDGRVLAAVAPQTVDRRLALTKRYIYAIRSSAGSA